MLRIAIRRRKRNDSGYMLLVLMLAVAIMTITMLSIARNYKRGIVRDREVEMIHRGEQYERAIQRYYRKNGQYPTSLDALEDTNKVRYLRKRYKDPMSPDGEWKLVHPTDIKLGVGGLVGTANSTQTTGNPFQASANLMGQTGAAITAQNTTSTTNTGTVGDQASAGTADSGDQTAGSGETSGGTSGSGSLGGTTSGTNAANPAGIGGNNAGPVLGGGPVIGVVSKSKAEGIHSFADKSKYSEWFFIYDPSQDKGQQLKGPYNPNLQLGGGAATNGTGQSGSQQGQQSTFGTSGTGSAFGTASPTTTPTNPTPATNTPQ